MSRPLRVVVWPGMPDSDGLQEAAQLIDRELEVEVISSNEDLELLLEQDDPWDLITPSDYLVENLVRQGRLAELDPQNVLQRDVLAGWCRSPEYDPSESYSFPLAFGTTGCLYDSRRVKDCRSWSDFFDPAPGVKVGLLAELREVVGAALVFSDHSPNSVDPTALDTVAAVLAKQRPAVASVSSDDFTGPVRDGKVGIHQAWSGPASMAVRQTPGLSYSIPEEGALLWVTTAAIPINAADPEGARGLLNALIRPEIAKLAVERGGYSTPNDPARRLLPTELQNDPVLFPTLDIINRCKTLRPLSTQGEAAMSAAWPSLT